AAPIGATRCGGRIFPPFDKGAYLTGTSVQGAYTIDADLFGGQLKLDKLVITREKAPLITGSAALKKLDLGHMAKIALGSNSATRDPDDAKPDEEPQLGGELTGELIVKRLKLDDLGTTQARFVPSSLEIERGGQKLRLRPAPVNFVVANDELVVP